MSSFPEVSIAGRGNTTELLQTRFALSHTSHSKQRTCHRLLILPLYVSCPGRSTINPTGLSKASSKRETKRSRRRNGFESPEAMSTTVQIYRMSLILRARTFCTPKQNPSHLVSSLPHLTLSLLWRPRPCRFYRSRACPTSTYYVSLLSRYEGTRPIEPRRGMYKRLFGRKGIGFESGARCDYDSTYGIVPGRSPALFFHRRLNILRRR